MEILGLDKLPKEGSNLLFSDEVMDELKVSEASLYICRFVRIGVKDAQFIDYSLTQCQFEDSYNPLKVVGGGH